MVSMRIALQVTDQDLDEWVGGGTAPQEPLWSLYLCATDRGGGLETASIQASTSTLQIPSEGVVATIVLSSTHCTIHSSDAIHIPPIALNAHHVVLNVYHARATPSPAERTPSHL
eukprot:1194755-Prorocentrum_minimum.AAC.2